VSKDEILTKAWKRTPRHAHTYARNPVAGLKGRASPPSSLPEHNVLLSTYRT